MAILHELVADRRRRAAQHALRRRGAPRCRLREPARDQARPRVLPHARLRARRARAAARQRPDRCRARRPRLARRRPRPRRHPALAGGRRSATPATGSCRPSAMVQALYHRDRTGEGQFVDTSIMYAQLLNASIAWSLADGSRHGDRPQLDAMQLGWHATYRLYETADGWLCVAAVTDEHRAARWPPVARRRQGRRLHRVRARSSRRSAPAARRSGSPTLDAAGVPCEVSTPDFVLDLFDDPEMIEKGWVTKYRHPIVGDMDVMGLLFDLVGDARRRAGAAARAGPGHPGHPPRARLRRRRASTPSPRPAPVLDWRP